MDIRPSDAAIIAQAQQRGDGSICPSEVARALAVDWRPLLKPVRRRAGALSDAAAAMRGVIRLRQKRPPPQG